ncbi:MAG: enoyl-CoA hydratase [Rhizobiaceae bacterium]|nr:enoyl-CoA hydratase [Rhizobiaceae bacterium]
MGEILAMPRNAEQRSLLDVQQSEGVLRLTLTNPPANALSIELISRLQAELDRSAEDSSVRVIVIAAAGKVFSGGHDLKEMTAHRGDADGGEAFFKHTFDACGRMMQSIMQHPRPVIAEVNGIATAAGCQLVATCDLAIASDKATFGVNGIDVGLFCTTPGVALARGLKPKHAMEMLLTGEMIDAATAREFGLVNRVVPPEYLAQVVSKYAQAIVSKSPSGISRGKQAFYRQAEMGLTEAYDYAAQVMVDNMLARDAREGISAFIEKRKPQWGPE